MQDFLDAKQVLLEVLDHIKVSAPEASPRVMMLNNTIVSLAATIEETLRSLFNEYLTILEENVEEHTRLRADLIKSNLDCAINELKGYRKSPDFKAAASIAENLEKCMSGKKGYRLLKAQLTYNQGNFKSAQLTEIARAVGVAHLWKAICDCDNIRDFTGDNATDSNVTRITAMWNEFYEERDLVVHRISQANGWGDERIRQSIEFSELIVSRLAICLAMDSQAFLNEHQNVITRLANRSSNQADIA